MLVAAGVIAAVGYGAYTLMSRVGAHSSGQLGTFLIEDAYGGGPLPGARLTFVPLACQGDGCQPAETTARGVVGRMFSTNARGEIRAGLDATRVVGSVTGREYHT